MTITLAVFAPGCSSTRTVSAHGVRVDVPRGWHVVEPVQTVDDPRTLLVVGTAGVDADPGSGCEIASYHVPARGAVVVVVGWRGNTTGGGTIPRGRAPLKNLVAVTRPSFECFPGRGAATELALAGKAYQVNVMVGDGASKRRVTEALAVARSFDVVR
jgi:hypothetical protein